MVESQVGGRPRLCRLVIWSDFDGYGFNLHAEKSRPGQYVGKVDEGSPAAAAGLQEGDRIVEVNGVNIAKENHKQVVQRIKSIPREAELLVVDLETDRVYRERDEPITSADAIRTTAERKQQLPPSDSYPDEDEDRRSTASIVSNASSFAEKENYKRIRFRFPTVSPKNLGFEISLYRHNGFFVISKVVSPAAEHAGLKVGDRIRRINEVDVSRPLNPRSDVLRVIEAVPNECRISVIRFPYIRDDIEDCIFRPSSPISSSHEDNLFPAESSNVDIPTEYRPRLCKIKRDSSNASFGFTLLTDKRTSLQYIGKVRYGTLAAAGGLKPYDRIIEVNGINVDDDDHDEIANRIQKSGREVILLVVDSKAENYCKRKGLDIHGRMKGILCLPDETNGDGMLLPDGFKVRSCDILRRDASESLGFSIQTVKRENVPFIRDLTPNSPATVAGLSAGDVILAIDGADISSLGHREIVDRIMARESGTTLLVADRKTYDFCKERNIPLFRGKFSPRLQRRRSFQNDEENVRSDAEEVPRIEVTVESPMIVVENFDEKNEGLVVEVIEPDGKENEDSDKNDQSLRVEEVEEHEDDDIDNLNLGEDEKEDKRREKQPSPPPLSGRDMGSAGNSPSPRSTPSPDIPEQRDDDFSKGSNGLNLNMTAAEMREKICSKKKRDPRKDDRMDIRRKYEIVQTL